MEDNLYRSPRIESSKRPRWKTRRFRHILVLGAFGSWVTGLAIAFFAPIVYMMATHDDFPLGFTLGSWMVGATVAIGGSIFSLLVGIVVLLRDGRNSDLDS